MDKDLSVSIRIQGHPVAKERPRVTRHGGTFTPKATVEYETTIAKAWRDQYGDLQLGGKLEAFLYFGSFTDVKQDVDNLAKSALDGLQKGGAFVNGDEQVYKLTASKYPTTRDEEHTIIVLRFLDYDETA
jgi:Holliday junction resolvase RusA-like endonuclease